MTITIDKTAKRYYGKMASDYERNRKPQRRWALENETVEAMLTKLKPRSVLDVPCGTGRFIPVYSTLRVKEVIAVDVSDEMLALAKQKKVNPKMSIDFIEGDARKVDVDVDVAVCVRFLDLIDETAMRQVITALMYCTRKAIICTIRLGSQYVAKVNTATHDEKKFRKLLKKHGWKIAKDVPVFTQGWHIILLKPR